MPPISERIYRVQAPYSGNAVHLYLVRGAKLALIDSGAADSPKTAVEPALAELGLQWSDLDYLLNTHGHADHAGGNGELKALAPDTHVAIHPADAFLLGGPEAHLNSPTDAANAMRMLGREDLVAEREAILHKIVGRSSGADRELGDGDVVDLGNDVKLTVVHTPGHTAGSVCYVFEAEQTVLTGDAVQGHGWRTGLGPIYHDTEYLRSLDRIGEIGAQTMGMGHTFGWGGVLNNPVRTGSEIAATLDASRKASSAIDQAAKVALERLGPDATFLELCQAAFGELVYELAIVWDRRTVVPAHLAGTMRAHLSAQGWRAAEPGVPERVR